MYLHCTCDIEFNRQHLAYIEIYTIVFIFQIESYGAESLGIWILVAALYSSRYILNWKACTMIKYVTGYFSFIIITNLTQTQPFIRPTMYI